MLIATLWLHRPTRELVPAASRLLPDLARLVARVGGRQATPCSSKLAVGGLGVWLAMPYDPVPDILPAMGQLDDLIVAVIVLRWVLRRAGAERLRAAWSGSPEGLALVERLLRIAPVGC